MDDTLEAKTPRHTSRRAVVTTAAWAVPVVAVTAAAPFAAASPEPPKLAQSIGGTTSSPIVNNVGRVEVFGLDANGDDGYFPAGQTFVLTASFGFGSTVTSISGGTLTQTSPTTWTLTPNPGVVKVTIRFNSSVVGTYSVKSQGPVDPTWSSNGSVLAS